MHTGIKKYEDIHRLLFHISQRQSCSHHSQINLLNVAYSLGFDTEYAHELMHYLRVHRYVDVDSPGYTCMLTPEGWREATRHDPVVA